MTFIFTSDLELQLGSYGNIQEMYNVMEGEQAEICAQLLLNRHIGRNFSLNISTTTEAGDAASNVELLYLL